MIQGARLTLFSQSTMSAPVIILPELVASFKEANSTLQAQPNTTSNSIQDIASISPHFLQNHKSIQYQLVNTKHQTT